MDLSEVRGSHARHPWETARAVAIERILRDAKLQPESVLDYGCGDGFTGERVFSALGAGHLLGFDIHLTDERIASRSLGNIRYANDWSQAEAGSFDLCLLCDVIEHVADDQALLEVVRERLSGAGQLLITVPAFQALFSTHDRALRHFRRYALRQLEQLITASGFELTSSGYLFGALLAGRSLSKLRELLGRASDSADFGIGAWKGSAGLTRALETVLNWDNAALIALAARGIKLPGLSAWALCKKRPS